MRQIPSPVHVLEGARKYVLELTPQRALILSFLMLSLVGTLLLKLPIASHRPTSWGEALFTAVSASTVTGMAVLDTGSHFTLFGHWVLLFLVQAGGLGLMTFGLLIIQLVNGRLGLGQRAVLREVVNQTGQGDVRRLLLWLFAFTAVMELLGTFLLALQWIPEMGFSRGLFYSFFHAVSAFNNAGISLSANSLSAYAGNPLINIVIPVLFITGGIGFVVIIDMLGKKRFRDYALHTKLMLIGTLVLNVVAPLIVFVLEYGNEGTLGKLNVADKLWAAWFQGVVTRTAGFNTVDIAALLPATSFFMMGMMFIGAGSGSTASGIKLSTFIVLLLATRTFLLQQTKPVIFGRSIGADVVFRALAITVIALFCVITGTFLLTVTESAPFLDLAFEAVAAFSTAGLSRGITADLSYAGQIVILVLMLVGRVGPLTLAFTLATARGARIQYPEGQINVG